MSDSNDQLGSLLTVSEVRERSAELQDLERQIDRLQSRRRAVFEWLEIVARLIGREKLDVLLTDATEAVSAEGIADAKSEEKVDVLENEKEIVEDNKVTWTSFIEDQVIKNGGKLSFSDARSAVISNRYLAPILKRTDKSFHGAIAKLANNGRAVRHNGWIFTPQAYQAHIEAVARGEAVDDYGFTERAGVRVGPRGSPMGDAIREFLITRPNGASGPEIIEHVKNFERFHDVVKRNHTSVYNVLTRLVRRNEIRKESRTYLAAFK